MTPISKYGQTQKETASPERLMVMLFEAALRNIRVGAAALEAGRPSEASAPLAKANDIVLELHATLVPGHAPQLCEKLADVYMFVLGRLLQASTSRDSRFAREAERAFAPIVEGFQGAVQQISHRQATP